MPRVRFVFFYDGTEYHGWQKQANTSRTVQELVENSLSRLSNQRISVVSSGRTDAGVHARAQTAHADLPERTANNPRLLHAVNSLLPKDIRAIEARLAADDFHALRGVKKKMYLFFINPSAIQPPSLARYCWHLRLPLDWGAMERAAAHLRGAHDFKAFASADHCAKTTRRVVYEASWGEVSMPGFGGDANLRVFRVVGSGFLKNMVRSIVGTLVWIGSGKREPEQVQKALLSGDRGDAGPTAPPHGLWLWDVLY